MAHNYQPAVAMATRTIAKYGRTISLLQSTDILADVAKPWRGSESPHTEGDPTTAIAKGAFVSLTLSDLGFSEENTDGQLQKRGSQFVLVSPGSIIPAGTDVTQYDAVLDGDAAWAIVKVHTLRPGDTVLLHAIEVTQ